MHQRRQVAHGPSVPYLACPSPVSLMYVYWGGVLRCEYGRWALSGTHNISGQAPPEIYIYSLSAGVCHYMCEFASGCSVERNPFLRQHLQAQILKTQYIVT